MIMKSIIKRYKIVLIIVSSVLLILFLSLIGFLFILRESFDIPQNHRIPFDSSVWKEETSFFAADSKRPQMIDNLIESKILDGMSYDDVIATLGNAASNELCDLTYTVGKERGFGVDIEYLCINIEDQRVISYQLLTD